MSVIVMLTKRSLVVDADDAERITLAIERGDRTIRVSSDMLGDGICSRPTTVVLAHVMFLYDCDPADDALPGHFFDGKVVAIGSRR